MFIHVVENMNDIFYCLVKSKYVSFLALNLIIHKLDLLSFRFALNGTDSGSYLTHVHTHDHKQYN